MASYRRKRRYSRKKSYGRKRFRRTYRRSRRSYRRRSRSHSFKRSAPAIAVTLVGPAPAAYAVSTFKLDNLPNYSEFTALYDAYRINCVVLTFKPDYNLHTTATGNTAAQIPAIMPEFHWAIDLDDDTAPTSISELSQYRTYHHRTFNKPISVKIYPRIATAVYRSAVSTAYGIPTKPQWINLAYPDVPHYGIKWAVDNVQFGASQGVSFKAYTTYYLSMKDYR